MNSIENYLKNKKNLLEINEKDILICFEQQQEEQNFYNFYIMFKEELINKINKNDNVVIKKEFFRYDNKINKINELINTFHNYISDLEDIKTKLLTKKVEFIAKLNQPEQRSKQWYEMRKNMLTASDIGALLGYSKYNNRKSVIKKKCGEGPKFRGNIYTLHGQKYEEVAKQIYETRYNKKVDEYGLIQHPTIPILGASPDGISTDGIMLEIKCPPKRKITGEVPPHYWVQMQVQLQVCSLDRCDFIECLIEEYEDDEEYNEDIFDPEDFEYYDILPKTFDINHINIPNDRKTVYGLEKGIIGEIRVMNEENKYESQFFYPPFNLTSEEQIKWLENKENELNINIEFIYWKLSFSSVVKVMRDDKWWNTEKVEENLYNTWDEILERREDNKTNEENTVDLSNLKISNEPIYFKDLPKCEISSEEEDNLNTCLLSDDDN